jgi:hypothetical protein
MLSPQARPVPRDGVVVQQAESELVLLDLEAGTYFALSGVGGRVWALCDGTRCVEDVVQQVLAEFEAPAETVRADVTSLLAELSAENLLRLSE